MEVYDSPSRGKRPIFYGLGNFFWSDVQEQLPADLYRRNREMLEAAWKEPAKATDYDLTAPLNATWFANEFTFQSVIFEVRFRGNELSEVVLHPVELGYGERLMTSGIPRLVSDGAEARRILDQVVKQTEQFGLPPLGISYSGTRGVIATSR
jgi:poly-gamma-glutamate synthesis protein (capsule biosynthesis protein)